MKKTTRFQRKTPRFVSNREIGLSSKLKPDRLLGLLGHELVHVGQYADGMMWLSYLWASRNGYYDNHYEKEAYKIGGFIRDEIWKKYGDSCPEK